MIAAGTTTAIALSLGSPSQPDARPSESATDTSAPSPSETSTTTIPPGDVFQIGVGECFSDETPEGETVSDVAIVDCTEPHIWEAYKSILIDNGTYPGEAAVSAKAETDCKSAFADYVGIAYDNSTLYLSFYYPTQQTWDEFDDREILCIVTTADDFATKTTGSVKGSGR